MPLLGPLPSPSYEKRVTPTAMHLLTTSETQIDNQIQLITKIKRSEERKTRVLRGQLAAEGMRLVKTKVAEVSPVTLEDCPRVTSRNRTQLALSSLLHHTYGEKSAWVSERAFTLCPLSLMSSINLHSSALRCFHSAVVVVAPESRSG